MKSDDHYLKRELYDLVRTDPAIFEFLQAGSLDGIWYWDLEDSDHEWMSPRFWQVFGYDPADKEHLAAEWQDMIHPDDLATALDNFNKHYADPNHPYDQLVRYRHKDGSTVWVRCRGLIIRDAEGKPRRMLGTHNEVTALKLAEEALRRKNAELEAANAELERFASVASHDLQEPLRKILAFSDLLVDALGDGLPEDAERHLARVTDGARRMSELVQDVLELSRTGRVELDFVPTPVDDALDTALFHLSERVALSGAQIDRGPLPTLHLDSRHFPRVFLNLLSNALKFAGDEPPSVRISAEELDDSWRIHVADQGIGFDPQYSEQVFQSFRRLHGRGKYEGTGIGLAICKTLVQRHGGALTVESALGEGATFTIELPKDGPESSS